MNRTGSKILHGLLLATSGLVGSTLIASTAALAGGGPTGGTVAVGSATIIDASPTQTVVNQSSNKALINWNSFSIPGGSSVKFNQPNSKSLTVNRVTGSNASTIDGALLANGNVWLINANGILFGKGSQINVGALLATTSDLSDDDFKSGNYSFKPAANPNASVVNKGRITAGTNGSVVLSAPRVSNEGLIQANLGTVVLGGAEAFTVDMTGDNLLRYQITAPVATAPKDANGSVASALVSNSGKIIANGGHVMMTARAARNVEDNVINNSGIVEATTVSSHNGIIDLDAGPDGTVNDSGTLDASGTTQGQTGGAVNVTGGTVNVADGATINASGNAGGGTIQIGGGLHGQGTLAHAQRTMIGKATILADATGKGSGGTVSVWSDGDTSFAGSISAKGGAQGGNGGQVETSGHNLGIAASAKVDTSAPLGLTGDWLLDPVNLLLTSNTSQPACCGSTCVDVASIMTSLSTTDVTETASNSLILDTNSDITWNSANSLYLLSQGVLTVGSNIQNAGNGSIALIAGWDGSTVNPAAFTSAGVYGNSNAVLTIGSGGYTDVSVGSKDGKTTVLGYDVNLTANQNGGPGHAQIGYAGGGASGTIDVRAIHDVTLAGGRGNDGCSTECSALDAYAQIGHGGSGTSGTNSGTLSVIAGNNVTLLSGDTPFGTYAQIGNGGEQTSSASETANITITATNLNLISDEDYSQIGSGGAQADTITGGNITVNVTGNVTLAGGGTETWGYAQIGNGGDTSHGNTGGDIFITAGGDVFVTGGGDYAQIGNGGWGSSGNDSGNITVNATGNISVSGSNVTTFAYAQIGNGGESQTGTDSGNISLKGNNLTLTAAENGRYAQIGNGSDESGAGSNASGNISLTLAGNLTLAGAVSSSGIDDYVEIGNTAFSTTPSNGIAGGNISINVGKTTKVIDGVGDSWIGNLSNVGTETGSVSLITRDVDDTADNNDDIGQFIVADILGGNVTIGITDANATTKIGELDYTSGNALTILSAGDIWVKKSVENSGTGNITIVTGWNPAVAAANLTTTAGAYGNGGKTLTVGGASASGDVFVGSEGGATNIYTGALMVSANNGYAQIGYHGMGTGAIDVFATGNIVVQAVGAGYIAQIGNGDGTSSGAVGGNISVTGGNLTLIASANNTAAAIGNIAGTNGSESGNITVNTNGGALALNSTGKGSTAQIGNWANGNTTGTSSGNINIAAGNVSINAAGIRAFSTIGNGNKNIGVDSGALSGNISITATTLTMSANASGALGDQSRIGNLGNGAVSGNINITTTGNILLTGSYGGLTNIGNLSAPMGPNGTTVQGQGTGDITVQSGGSISLLGNGGEARIESGGATSGNVSVTAAGDITLAVDNASPAGGHGSAIIGALTNGNGTVNVVVKSTGGKITLDAADAGSFATIGNSENGVAGNIGGNVSVTANGNITLSSTGAASIARIGNSGDGNATSGDLSILAGGIFRIVGGDTTASNGSLALIGNTNDQAGGAIAGNVTVTAASVDGIGDSIFNDLMGGNFTLNSLSNKTIEIGDTRAYNSSYNLTVNSGGDIVFDSSLLNSGSGNITFVSAGDVTIGGAGASGGVAVGSKDGVTTIVADTLLLSAVNGYAQLGYHGGGSGAIVATIAGDVTLAGGNGAGDYAQIGDGGYKVSGSSSADISVIAGGDVTLDGGAGQEAYAQIGNGGAESNSNSTGYSETGLVTVSGATVTLAAGDGTGSYVQIGHGGYKSGAGLNGIATIGGDIAVEAVTSVHLTGGGDEAYAQIGNGGDFVNTGAANGSHGTLSGDIDVAVLTPNSGTGSDPLTLLAGAGLDAYAQIGNGGQGENTPAAGATVTFDVSGNVTVADIALTGSNTGENGYAQIGNGDVSKTGYANVSGQVTLGSGTEITTLSGTATGATAGLGNATGFGTVSGTVFINDTNDAGGSVAYIIQNPTSPTYVVTTVPETPPPPPADAGSEQSGPTPLDQLSDGSEGSVPSDGVAESVGRSLGQGKSIYVTSKTLIPGMLKQIVTLTPNSPHGVPPADVDYSSWGNEALWRW